MATDLLKLFAQRNGCFPNKIVFYRDGPSSFFLFEQNREKSFFSGVDDGHFQKVLDNEVRALQNACKGNNLSTVFFLRLEENRFFFFSSLFEQSITENNIHHREKTSQHAFFHS